LEKPRAGRRALKNCLEFPAQVPVECWSAGGQASICSTAQWIAMEKKTSKARKQKHGRSRGGAHPGRLPLVGIIMGSSSDWETMEHAARTLEETGVPYEKRVVSAHRTPDLLFEYASNAEKRGIEVIIAGAGGAAHLPGMTASKTVLPVLGVPVESKALKGLDSLLSIAQMPGGIPVGTLAIGKAGAINAALLAAAILGGKYPQIREALRKFRSSQTKRVLANPDPSAAALAPKTRKPA
jgi:5-(carboxyamino)imidazole ribonucleotide mutase